MGDWLDELRYLHQELSLLKRPLEGLLSRVRRSKSYKDLQIKIRKELDDIDDTITTCMNTHMIAKKQILFTTTPTKESSINFAHVVKEIRKNKLPMLRKYIARLSNLPEVADDRVTEETRKKAQKIVGFEEEAKEFIEFISGESNKLEIASLVGMAALGKTTLTWKIYEDPRIKYEFPVRIWVNVSDTQNMKIVLYTILRKFTWSLDEPWFLDEPVEELVVKVRNHLKHGKFFLVMDDIWTLEAWDKLKEILPRDNHMGRVLVTTRNSDVAVHSSTREAHYLRFLTPKESWELLQYEVYGELDIVHEDLKDIGKDIATDCDGLPLLIMVIGGILVEKTCSAGNNVSEIKKEWEEVSTSVKSSKVDGDKKQLWSSTISLSYEKIPNGMRNCFLYLAVFPEDADIPVKELLRLWIAEGFIESGGMSLEQDAFANLKELINRNLVMVKGKKHDGEPKICYIHSAVRDFCKTEAKYKNRNLFQEITISETGFEPCDTERFRRICIHSYPLGFLKKTKKISNAHSFLCFDRSPMVLNHTDMACVTDSFRFLRVYNAKSIIFPIFPLKFVQLSLLKYFTLVVEQCTSLPEVFSELRNLQTLIVDVTSSTLYIKADLWKMIQLRHFKTNSSITLKKDGKGDGGGNLQTLSRLSPESCTNEFFKRAKNLITLEIQGELNKLGNSDCLGNLYRLHKLKLINEVPNGVAAENPLRCLLDSKSFPPNLKILVLSGTYMQWSKMSILSSLGFLEVLKLKENAFTGNYWEAVNVFHRLEYLQLERSTELVSWKAIGHPFPKLRFLLLYNCEKLIEVPAAVCVNLENLCVERVTKDLVSSVEAIDQSKRIDGVAFKLYIAPGDIRRA